MVEPFNKKPSNVLQKTVDDNLKKSKHEDVHKQSSQYFKSLQQARDLEMPPDKDIRNTKMGVTLRFSMPDLEQEFCEMDYVNSRTRVTIAIFSMLLFEALTGAIDATQIPVLTWNSFETLLMLRYIGVCPILLLVGVFSLTKKFQKYMQQVLCIAAFVSGSMFVAQLALTLKETNSLASYGIFFLAHVMTLLVYIFSLSKLHFPYAVGSAVLFLVPFVAIVVVFAPTGGSILIVGVVIASALLALQTRSVEIFVRKNFIIDKVVETEKERLQLEKYLSESLLLNIFPKVIAQKFTRTQTMVEEHPNVTIFFSDITGFTELSSQKKPHELVAMLNELFSGFDNIVQKYKLEKIKTIGDAYMCVGGLPLPNPNHAENIAAMALDVMEYLVQYNNSHPNEKKINIRVGIHTGDCIAGVVGKIKYMYDLYGDTVAIANSMESTGVPGKIQVSQPAYELLKDKFNMVERGFVDLPGGSMIKTYFLLGKKDPQDTLHSSGPLPSHVPPSPSLTSSGPKTPHKKGPPPRLGTNSTHLQKSSKALLGASQARRPSILPRSYSSSSADTASVGGDSPADTPRDFMIGMENPIFRHLTQDIEEIHDTKIHPFKLTYTIKPFERRYMESFSSGSAKFRLRLGLFIIIAAAVATDLYLLQTTWMIKPSFFLDFHLLWHLAISFPSVLVFILSFFPRFYRVRHIGVALMSLSAGIGLVASGFYYQFLWLGLAALYLCIYFLTPFFHGFIITTLIHVAFLVYAILIGLAVLPTGFFLSAIFLCSGLAAYLLERMGRFTFLKEMLLGKQQECLHVQQSKSQELLENLLPGSIAEQLKSGHHQQLIASRFPEVTLMFAHLEGLTKMQSSLTNMTAVFAHVNKLFMKLDEITLHYGMEKIKTIGMTYFVAGGLPSPHPNHTKAMALLAVNMQRVVDQFNMDNGFDLSLRVGINVGACVAGVIGSKKFTYDVWGDSVNVTSRMESSCPSGRIQVTQEAYEKLTADFELQERGVIAIKGKGDMKTYFLNSLKPATQIQTQTLTLQPSQQQLQLQQVSSSQQLPQMLPATSLSISTSSLQPSTTGATTQQPTQTRPTTAEGIRPSTILFALKRKESRRVLIHKRVGSAGDLEGQQDDIKSPKESSDLPFAPFSKILNQRVLDDMPHPYQLS